MTFMKQAIPVPLVQASRIPSQKYLRQKKPILKTLLPLWSQ